MSWLEWSGHLSKFCKGLMLSQGFAATPRTLAMISPELCGGTEPANRPCAPAICTAADDSDRTLLVRIQHRDKEAFQQLYIRYHGRLAGFLTRLTQSHDAAEEIINDTLWAVWWGADSCGDVSRVSTWIIGMAYRRWLKPPRRPAPGGRAALPAIANGGAIAVHGAETAVETNVEQERIKHALARLPLKLRFVLEFAYSLGQSSSEIAQILECPLDAVTARMIRARRRLKSILAQDYTTRPDRRVLSYQNRTRPVSMCTKSELA